MVRSLVFVIVVVRSAAGTVGFECAVQLDRGVLGNMNSGRHAAVVGDHRTAAIVIYDVYCPAIENGAVTPKHVRLGSFPSHGGDGHDKYVFQFFDAHVNVRGLSGAKSP